jgi:hypothetical protein
VLLTEATGQPHGAAVTETYLTMAGLRERGWTDAMIREYLGEPDATRPNPRYWSAAPMKLYLAERAEAAEASLEWVERKTRGARRRAAGVAAADRKRVETESLARQLAADLVASLVFPADPQQAAIETYNKWHWAFERSRPSYLLHVKQISCRLVLIGAETVTSVRLRT